METKTKLHYGWFVIAGLILMMLVFGTINTLSLFMVPVTAELGISMTTFSLTVTVQMLAMAAGMPFVTKMFNKMDIRITLSAAVILTAVAFLLNSVAKNIFYFYVTSALLGIGGGFISMMLVPIIVNSWFAAKAATLVGFCTSAMAIGGAFFSSLGAWIMENYGWRSCALVWAIIVAAVGIPVSLFVIRKSPADKGLKPYGYDETAAGSQAADMTIKVPGISASKARKLPAYYILTITIALVSGANIFYMYINAYLIGNGVNTVVAGGANSVLMIGGMIGNVLIGMLCDKNNKIGVIVCLGVSVIAYPVLALFAGTNVALIYGASLLIGITYQPSGSVLGPMVAGSIFGQKDFASIWGTIVSCISLVGAAGSAVWGLISDNLGFQTGMMIVAVIYLICIISMLFMLKAGKKYQETLWTAE